MIDSLQQLLSTPAGIFVFGGISTAIIGTIVMNAKRIGAFFHRYVLNRIITTATIDQPYDWQADKVMKRIVEYGDEIVYTDNWGFVDELINGCYLLTLGATANGVTIIKAKKYGYIKINRHNRPVGSSNFNTGERYVITVSILGGKNKLLELFNDINQMTLSKSTRDPYVMYVYTHPNKDSIYANSRIIPQPILSECKYESLVDDIKAYDQQVIKLKSVGVSPCRTYLIYGPPGTGKTSIISRAGLDLDLRLIHINLNAISNFSELIQTMRNDAGTEWRSTKLTNVKYVLILEELDTYDCTKSRDVKSEDMNNDDTFDTRRIGLNDILSFLDGNENNLGDYIIFITTNHPDKLDPAITRPGRINYVMHVGNADTYQIVNIAKKFGVEFTQEQIDKLIGINASPALVESIAYMMMNGIEFHTAIASANTSTFISSDSRMEAAASCQ